jgi:hypothetical protein
VPNQFNSVLTEFSLNVTGKIRPKKPGTDAIGVPQGKTQDVLSLAELNWKSASMPTSHCGTNCQL